jgi:hypothetical protein
LFWEIWTNITKPFAEWFLIKNEYHGLAFCMEGLTMKNSITGRKIALGIPKFFPTGTSSV